MERLSHVQINLLADVAKGRNPDMIRNAYMPNTLSSLFHRGLITRSVDQFMLTKKGVAECRDRSIQGNADNIDHPPLPLPESVTKEDLGEIFVAVIRVPAVDDRPETFVVLSDKAATHADAALAAYKSFRDAVAGPVGDLEITVFRPRLDMAWGQYGDDVGIETINYVVGAEVIIKEG